MLLHVDPSGVPRQPRMLLVEGQNSGYGGPSLVHVGGDLYAAFSRYPDGEWLEQVWLDRWTCTPGEMDVCAAQDAAADGLDVCESPVLYGWMWDGSACLKVEGCSCAGEDCDALARTARECASDRTHCP
jgi:hypothetical protein